MRAEYLIFDLVVLLGPPWLGRRLHLPFDRHRRAALVATGLAAIVLAADAVLEAEGVETFPVWTVPRRGVLSRASRRVASSLGDRKLQHEDAAGTG